MQQSSMTATAAKALRITPSGQDRRDTHRRGTVVANNGTSLDVRIGDASDTTKCSPFCTAEEGDTVLVLVMASGQCAAIATLVK